MYRHQEKQVSTVAEDWSTGTVRVDPLFQAPDPARVGVEKIAQACHTTPACLVSLLTNETSRVCDSTRKRTLGEAFSSGRIFVLFAGTGPVAAISQAVEEVGSNIAFAEVLE